MTRFQVLNAVGWFMLGGAVASVITASLVGWALSGPD